MANMRKPNLSSQDVNSLPTPGSTELIKYGDLTSRPRLSIHNVLFLPPVPLDSLSTSDPRTRTLRGSMNMLLVNVNRHGKRTLSSLQRWTVTLILSSLTPKPVLLSSALGRWVYDAVKSISWTTLSAHFSLGSINGKD